MPQPRSRAPRPRAARRQRSRRAPPATRALFRLCGAGVLLAAAIVYLPPAQRAAATLHSVFADAVGAGRLASGRRAAIAAQALRFRISYDLAAAIEQAALDEGIDPDLAFRLVRVESGFHERAESPVGARGLTQLMPATAATLHQGIDPDQLFDRETNLRLGFRYLRWLIRVHEGNVDEALHAYNRGPGTVARIRAAGGNPANGYADRVLRNRADVAAYRGNGLAPASALTPPPSPDAFSDPHGGVAVRLARSLRSASTIRILIRPHLGEQSHGE